MDIERVREAALAEYEGLTEDKRNFAQRIFEVMDRDKSGDVSIDEFVAFLSHIGLQNDNHYCLFVALDTDDSGTLDFKELVTFFYILRRDEHRNVLNSRSSTDVPRWKASWADRRTRQLNNRGWSLDWKEILNLFASGIQIVQFLTGGEDGCSIM